jgi:hypothetical protein
MTILPQPDNYKDGRNERTGDEVHQCAFCVLLTEGKALIGCVVGQAEKAKMMYADDWQKLHFFWSGSVAPLISNPQIATISLSVPAFFSLSFSFRLTGCWLAFADVPIQTASSLSSPSLTDIHYLNESGLPFT